jgi:hypothetical protein
VAVLIRSGVGEERQSTISRIDEPVLLSSAFTDGSVGFTGAVVQKGVHANGGVIFASSI